MVCCRPVVQLDLQLDGVGLQVDEPAGGGELGQRQGAAVQVDEQRRRRGRARSSCALAHAEAAAVVVQRVEGPAIARGRSGASRGDERGGQRRAVVVARAASASTACARGPRRSRPRSPSRSKPEQVVHGLPDDAGAPASWSSSRPRSLSDASSGGATRGRQSGGQLRRSAAARAWPAASESRSAAAKRLRSAARLVALGVPLIARAISARRRAGDVIAGWRRLSTSPSSARTARRPRRRRWPARPAPFWALVELARRAPPLASSCSCVPCSTTRPCVDHEDQVGVGGWWRGGGR